MKKDAYYEYCEREERHLMKISNTFLLAELLKTNYQYSMHKSYGITGENIFKKVFREEQYINEEKEQIIKNAITILNIKYGYPIKSDIMKQFYELNFEK